MSFSVQPSFLYQDPQNLSLLVINGEYMAPDKKTLVGSATNIVQLRRARQEESDFDWIKEPGSLVKEVQIINVMVFDATDIRFLLKLVALKVKVVFAANSLAISPEASAELTKELKILWVKNITAAPGSYITVPFEEKNGDKSTALFTQCQQSGFKVRFINC